MTNYLFVMDEEFSRLPAHFSYLVQSARRCNWYKMNYRDRGLSRSASERVFNLCVCSPLDNILTSLIYNRVEQIAPNIHLVFKASLNQNTSISYAIRRPNSLLAMKNSVVLNLPAYRYLR
ncbi:probable HTH-type transcriptional regulator LeuO [Salmonella enterica subsp. arizonae]|nr:probable HTH-type transcriptional regulator LeuO [Salmonella enterica subsp. arizonae]